MTLVSSKFEIVFSIRFFVNLILFSLNLIFCRFLKAKAHDLCRPHLLSCKSFLLLYLRLGFSNFLASLFLSGLQFFFELFGLPFALGPHCPVNLYDAERIKNLRPGSIVNNSTRFSHTMQKKNMF